MTNSDRKVTAFVDVNVVPMDRARVLEGHTVVVEGERITAVGPADEVRIPAGAQIVEGDGAYLMPGLADMHMHFTSIGQTFEGPGQLVLFLAEGVTTVRSLSGVPKHLAWRVEVVRGERPGPTIYSSGPLIAGLPDSMAAMRLKFRALVALVPAVIGLLIWFAAWAALRLAGTQAVACQLGRFLVPSLALLLLLGGLVAWRKLIPLHLYTARSLPFARLAETAGEARQAIREQKASGYDFVKVYDYLTEDAYLAAIDEAHKAEMYVVGHLLDELPPETIFTAGLQEVAHIDEFMAAHVVEKASPNAGFAEITLDYEVIGRSVSAARANDVLVVSNMVADEVIYKLLEDVDGGLAQPEYAVVSAEVINRWKTEGRLVDWQGQETWRRNVQMPFFKTLARALHGAGVPLLTGTDMCVEGLVPAHIHRELELLVEAGLTPFSALEAATKNAGISVGRMGRDGRFGTVAVGQRADLLLLGGNPLEDVSRTRGRRGVMARGRWFSQHKLDGMVRSYLAISAAEES